MRLFSAREENIAVGREMSALDPKRGRYCVISCEKKRGNIRSENRTRDLLRVKQT
jgi:hypothetical protein